MSRSKLYIRIGLALTGALTVAAIIFNWPVQNQPITTPEAPKADAFAGLELVDPSYRMVRHAAETGGNDRSRDLAIQWMDQQWRRSLPLNEEQEKWLLNILATNGHASWDPEYRFLFFNSAFNVLHMGKQQEALTRQLVKLANDAPEKTMRLYALQHIASQRNLGHLVGPLADEVKAVLAKLASQPDSVVAGSALSFLITWEGAETPADSQLIALALKLASDKSCAVDVRVSSLQAAREHSLSLARRIASDKEQPVLLRACPRGGD